MKDTVFYLEYPTKKAKRSGKHGFLGNHSGNCVATVENSDGVDKWRDVIAPIMDIPNSPVGLSGNIWWRDPKSANGYLEYLRTRCKRIPESQARSIHPKLFTFLESNND